MSFGRNEREEPFRCSTYMFIQSYTELDEGIWNDKMTNSVPALGKNTECVFLDYSSPNIEKRGFPKDWAYLFWAYAQKLIKEKGLLHKQLE